MVCQPVTHGKHENVFDRCRDGTTNHLPRTVSSDDLQSYPLWWWLEATTGLQRDESPCQVSVARHATTASPVAEL